MEENIRIDEEALCEDIKQKAEKNGFVVAAYVPRFDLDDYADSADEPIHFMPYVDVHGATNAITIAFTIDALERTIENLKKERGVLEAIAMVKAFSTTRSISIDNSKRGEDND